MKYPKVAKDCEDIFLSDDGEFELTCGKRNVYGEWHLCHKCRLLSENKVFLNKPTEKENERKKRRN